MSLSNNPVKHYVLVHWCFQPHGSFSSGGRWRDILLIEFSSIERLEDYLFEYIKENFSHVDINKQQFSAIDLCRISIEESDKLVTSNRHEISRVTSRHIWPVKHKLLMGCLANARIVATYHDQFAEYQRIQSEEKDNVDTNYCLITQLGNHPIHVKFLRGTDSLREEILQRFKRPFQTTVEPSQEQIDQFIQQTQTLSIQQFCNHVTSQRWHTLNNHSLHGVLVDFIIAGEPLLFNEQKD